VGANNVTTAELNRIRDEVQARADEIGDGIKLLLGNELYFSRSVIDKLRSGEALTLAGSRYVLVEFSTREHFDPMYQGLSDLIRAGFLPILAHVERYRCLLKKEYRINDFIELGCYIQMNASSLLGSFLDADAIYNRKLLKLGLVHFIGSDCHDDTVRVPCMRMTEKTLQKRCDERLLGRLFYENPLKVLENTYI
jgi:protein-tyrosine phosphatase